MSDNSQKTELNKYSKILTQDETQPGAQAMLRRIVLDHQGQLYNGTVRNISTTGALVEGLWNVPTGTIFKIHLSDAQVITATTRWCQEDRMGVEFAVPLRRDADGSIAEVQTKSPDPVVRPLLKEAG